MKVRFWEMLLRIIKIMITLLFVFGILTILILLATIGKLSHQVKATEKGLLKLSKQVLSINEQLLLLAFALRLSLPESHQESHKTTKRKTT
jgi:hypothetical protein